MKKLFAVGLIGLLPTLLMAQQVAMNNKNILSETAITSIPATTAGDVKTAKETRRAARETKQVSHTAKAFGRDFENASEAQWSAGKDSRTVLFINNNIQTTAWYSKGGNLLYTMLTYGADKLPRREQRIIAHEFDGYEIRLVDEVHQDDVVVYVVRLEDSQNIKIVTINDGTTNVYRAFKKI